MTERKRTRQSLGEAPGMKTQKQADNKKIAKITRKRSSKWIVEHPHGHIDLDEFYKIRGIMRETRDKYEIDWADGPDGKQYEPTWEPKANVTELAIREWEAQKAKSCQDGCLAKPSLEQQARQSAMLDSHRDEGVLNHEPRVIITADDDRYGVAGTGVAHRKRSRVVAKVLNNYSKLSVSILWEEAHLASAKLGGGRCRHHLEHVAAVLTKPQVISMDGFAQDNQKGADATEVASFSHVDKSDLAGA
jgi:hypothetical protein